MTTNSNPSPKQLHVDSWIWGDEKIVWGYHPSHAYTLKVLEPKKGRAGCMSLQYHDHKSETWVAIRGLIWILIAVDGLVATKIMAPGDIQNISPGMIHRLTGITADAQILEPSTPDRHAADKSVTKDVVRLHCVHGRAVVPARTPGEAMLVEQAIRYTEEAVEAIERGELPPLHNPDHLCGRGAFQINQAVTGSRSA
jgi:hypothetical protein